jgi:hypothetical protein
MPKILLVFCLFFAFAANCFAQAKYPPTRNEAYKSTLQSIDKNAADWMMSVKAVKPEDLGLSYKQGKRIVERRNLIFLSVMAVEDLANKERNRQTLAGEIKLLDSVKDLRKNLEDFASYLVDTDGPDLESQEKIGSLAGSIEHLALSEIQDIETSVLDYATFRAEQIEGICNTRH